MQRLASACQQRRADRRRQARRALAPVKTLPARAGGPDERLDHALSLTESAAKHRAASAGVHRRSPPALSGADDLLGGDPFQVGAGGREVRMPELALGSSDADVAPGLCEPYPSSIRAAGPFEAS
jgi:hypothetical protein